MEIKIVESNRRDGSKLKNTFLKSKNASDHLVIVLPGAGYSCQGPILYYATELFVEKGCDVMNVGYDYRFFEGSDEEYLETVKLDALNSIKESLKQGDYKHVTIIGKSVGTWGISLIDDDFWDKFPSLRVVWLTPVWTKASAFEKMLNFKWPSLHVIGSADPYYDASKEAQLVRTGKSVFVVKDADHGLDIKDDVYGTVSSLSGYLKNLEEFAIKKTVENEA